MEFLGWFEEPETLYIAMEYLKEGDLTKLIGTQLPQETVQNISKQILEGLKVMHQQGIAHRDLKPAVWVSPLNTTLNYIAEQSTDECIEHFSSFNVPGVGQTWRFRGVEADPGQLAQATTTFHTQVSTPVYSVRAPEVLGLDPNSETSNYTNAVDIWSLGRVIYELLVGTKLFVSEFQLSHYFYGTLPFPEARLRVLSPPHR